jgi:hypothetical protein
MEKNKISIATMTWARDEYEEQLLRDSMRCLAQSNIPVMVTDGGSGKEFLNYLRRFKNFNVSKIKKPSVFGQIRVSLARAFEHDGKFILYTESDKLSFFEQRLNDFISQAPDSDQAGVILAARSQKSLESFPASQIYTETVINHLCAEIIGKRMDFCYGPLLINRSLIPHLGLLDEEVGWGWRFFLYGLAKRLGYKIIPVEDEYLCPPEQQTDNQAQLIHRMNQLSQNLKGLISSQTISETELR